MNEKAEEGMDQHGGMQARVESMLGRLRTAIAGSWLVVLYLVFGTYVMYALTAHQLHHTIQSFKIDDKQITVWQVFDAHKKWRIASDNLRKSSDALSDTNGKVFDLKSQYASLQSKLDVSRQKIQDAVISLSDLAKLEGVTEQLFNSPAVSKLRLEAISSQLGTDKYARLKGNQLFQDQLELLGDMVDERDNLARQIADIDLQLSGSQRALQRHQKDVTTYSAALTQALTLNGKDLDPRVGDFLDSLTYLEAGERSVFLPDFSKMPSDMLTLTLVLAMGALGGTIHLTQLYFRQWQKNAAAIQAVGAGYYLFRPFLGAITALSVFILAKAGVLIVAAPGTNEIGASLSPFFVSFIGIVSGLLAEQALVTIQNSGRKWFGQAESTGRDRWAPRLMQAMGSDTAEIDANKTELSNLLGVSRDRVDLWLNGQAAVPHNFQLVIAAFLRTPPQELFTDMKNAEAAEIHN